MRCQNTVLRSIKINAEDHGRRPVGILRGFTRKLREGM